MAGSYPDVPGRRIAYDADGTILVVRRTAGADHQWMEIGSAAKTSFNSEDPIVTPNLDPGNQFNNHAGELAFIFPELREYDGIMAWVDPSPGGDDVKAVDTSGDTTNGIDGTFTNRIANYSDIPDAIDTWRDNITSQAVSNVRAVRVGFIRYQGGNMNWRHIHLYGEIAAGETPDRLLWVDNDTGSEFGLPIDYGDIPRGSAEEREVKLRNNSGSLTAASVQITGEALYESSAAWYTFREASGSLQSTLPLSSSIGAGSDSPVITIRRVTPDTEDLGLHAGRAVASVGSWS